MGRGRQKAKHTKLARKLKYTQQSTDYNALQAELSGNSSMDYVQPIEPEQEEYDEYSAIAAKYEIEDDEEKDSEEEN